MIRLAPRLAAVTAPLGRGVSLQLEAMTPAGYRALVADAARRLARLGPDADTDQREGVLFDAAWDHAVVGWEGVIDDSGVPLPCTVPTRDALFLLAPELRWRARAALDAQVDAGRLADAEGNASAASSRGGSGAGSSIAPTAPMPLPADDPPAHGTVAPRLAPKTTTL